MAMHYDLPWLMGISTMFQMPHWQSLHSRQRQISYPYGCSGRLRKSLTSTSMWLFCLIGVCIKKSTNENHMEAWAKCPTVCRQHFQSGFSKEMLKIVMPSCICGLVHHWFRQWLGAKLVPSYYLNKCWLRVNSSPPEQNGRHSAGNIFTCILVNEKYYILIKISLKFVPKGSIDNNPALVQIMAWCRMGDNLLSEPMLARFTDACGTRGRWVIWALESTFQWNFVRNSIFSLKKICSKCYQPCILCCHRLPTGL